MEEKLLILECAGLDMHAAMVGNLASLGLDFHPVTPPFPAVTCVSQATMRTGLSPREHGIVANGRFDRKSRRVEFWGQSAGLYRGERLWERCPSRDVAVMFLQQSLGDRGVTYSFSPAPIHKHHGGMLMGCHANPPELEAELTAAVGRRFTLSSYWGPGADGRSTAWIASATEAMMRRHGPSILYSYLPHLDYCQQREGPDFPGLKGEAEFLGVHLTSLLKCAEETGYEVLIWGDYAITQATLPVFPNRVLMEAGLFMPREVGGRLYPNLYDSRAFAMVDHQVAHVFVRQAEDVASARKLLSSLEGVERVQTPEEAGFDPADAGELVLTAAPGAWFAYPWWSKSAEAPDYAGHVDIHNKIGFDPSELFWGIPFLKTSQNPNRVRGTHGRTDTPAAFAVTPGLERLKGATSLLELANNLLKP